ncbi:uncharacterized protein T551_03724 [Pneumocystis jirovecii RU7]|uniref:Uncharacterized protein n=1 Tax=Pneumocystis jirovecii (strain RU7) TaxID=1408657 RepID=A0A0W4ZB70_PNEJ7|nr:uncharacterized protein T551_03724 [Pneumocystis jirovecii RU7]KTW25493.1 hypothetical protein T551_03724 [Pneumocystis jirovecii RU7]
MKAFIFSTLFCTIPVFSRSLGSIFNDDLDSRLLGPLRHLSALFVFYDGKDCVFLDGLCAELRKGYGDLTTLDSRLSDICRPKSDDAAYCKNLLETAMPEARELYTELKESESKFSLGECRRLLTLCNFFSGIFPLLVPLCEQLKLSCYSEIRKHAAFSALVEMGGNQMRTHDECVHKMEGVCHKYGGTTPEFKDLCLDLHSLCRTVIEKFIGTCEFLETQQTLNLKQLSENVCDLTHLCFNYGRNCNRQTHSFCKRLHSNCESKGYPVAPVLGSPYKTTPEKNLEEALTKYGVYMGTPDPNKKNPWDPSLCLLLQNSGQPPTKQACEHITWNCELLFSDPSLYPFCIPQEDRLANSICLGLKHRLEGDSGYLDILKDKLTSFGFIGGFGETSEKYTGKGLEDLDGLLELSSPRLTTHECTQLQADCYYYGIFGEEDLQRGCEKLSSKCYGRSWNKAVLKNLLGTTHQRTSGTTGLDSLSCQKQLAGKCKGLKYPDVHVTFACLHLESTCEVYTDDF